MRSLKSLWFKAAMMSCLSLSACTGVTLGPQIETKYVIQHAGRPMQALENTKVKGRVIDGTGDAVEQDVGGWIMMPKDHWETVKRNLKDVSEK